jgi:polypeptide N-acetylgalactosaminyltransferase
MNTLISRLDVFLKNNRCKERKYPADLPTTSIVIVFHNEAESTLKRGLTSLVNRSPHRYLKEIVLVDDCSQNRNYLYAPLEEFLKTLPIKTHIIRNKERLGLIRSRLVGANITTGETLTFLDAHIEANIGWLPPLLYEIRKNR